MKINDVNRAGAVNPYRKQMSTPQADQLNQKGKARDGVEVSEEARMMLEASTDPARAAKIAELKSSVSAGTYRVDAEVLAEKLLPFIFRGR